MSILPRWSVSIDESRVIYLAIARHPMEALSMLPEKSATNAAKLGTSLAIARHPIQMVKWGPKDRKDLLRCRLQWLQRLWLNEDSHVDC